MYAPRFTITNKILKNIGLIEAGREVIKNSPLLPLWEKKFQEEAVLRTVHHGTHIEGNPLNFSQVQKVVEGKEIVGRERDVQEVINYRNVVKFISSDQAIKRSSDLPAGKAGQEITQETIKKLHKLTTDKILPSDQCRVYRTKQVVVRNSLTGEISFRPPPAVEVPYLMEEFLTWLNGVASKETHPVLKAGVAQYEVVHIHPFLDGNGRVARALATAVLYKEGYDIRRFFSLEEYYDQDAEGYYQALQSVVGAELGHAFLLKEQKISGSEGGASNFVASPRPISEYDLTPWLEYFTLGLAIELTRVKERVQKISQDQALKEKLGGKQIYLSERQIKIIEFIQRAGVFKNKDFPVLFPMISEDTVLRELKDLMKKGIIKRKGRTKAARYMLK